MSQYNETTILKEYFGDDNCEGGDFDVIKGLDLDKTQIQLICHERQNDPEINKEIEMYLSSYNYVFHTANAGNIFYKKI